MLVNRGKWVAINLFPKASLHVGTNMSIGIFMFFAPSISALKFLMSFPKPVWNEINN